MNSTNITSSPDLLWPIIIIVLIVVVLPIMITISSVIMQMAKGRVEAAKEKRKRQLQLEEEQRKQTELAINLGRDRDNYYQEQLVLAREMRRTDKEIKQWAKHNYKNIIATEGQIIASVAKKLQWRSYFLGKPGGKEIITWYQESLKELRYAKQFAAEGGEYSTEAERHLQNEKLQAEILKLRRKLLKEVEEEEQAAPEGIVVDLQPERRDNGFLARIAQALHPKKL